MQINVSLSTTLGGDQLNAGRKKAKVPINVSFIKKLMKEAGKTQKQVANELADMFGESAQSAAPYFSRSLSSGEMTLEKLDGLGRILDIAPDALRQVEFKDLEDLPKAIYQNALVRYRPAYSARNICAIALDPDHHIKERVSAVLTPCKYFGMVKPKDDAELYQWYSEVNQAMQKASRDFLIRTGHLVVNEKGETDIPEYPKDRRRSYEFSDCVDKASENALFQAELQVLCKEAEEGGESDDQY